MAVAGALGNLLTLLAIPWAQSSRILGFSRSPLKYVPIRIDFIISMSTVSIFCFKYMYTTIFIVNLAAADFLYCVTSLPMYAATVRMVSCVM